MIGIWKGFLLDKSAEWGVPAGGEWTFVIHNNYEPHCFRGNLNVMWFCNGGNFPRVVVKFCEDPVRLKKEFENMRSAHEVAPAIVPTPFHFGPQGRLWGLWMEGVPGAVLMGKEAYAPDVLYSMVEMVASLHAAVRPNPEKLAKERYRDIVLEPLEALAQLGSSVR